MKGKIIAILVSLLVISIILAGNSMASDENGHDAAAPDSGDGIPAGSGFDSPNGPNGVDNSENGNDGPAPNSGDGIPDGPGW